MSKNTFVMKNKDGGYDPVLIAASANIEITGPVATTKLTHRFRNNGTRHVAAIYNFPLPYDATLLDLTIEINGKVLKGIVAPKYTAQQEYNRAVAEGDSAFLLEETNPCEYKLSVGNLFPGEEALVTTRFGQILVPVGNTTRYRLPIVIAWKYANPLGYGFDSDPITISTRESIQALGLTACINGASDVVESPTHDIVTTTDGDSLKITLSPGQYMDRDFILNLSHSNVESRCWKIDNGSDSALMSILNTPKNIPKNTPPQSVKPRKITILQDCSSSMDGDAMEQSRNALLKILDLLNNGDFLLIITFSGNPHIMTWEGVPITDHTREIFRQYILNLNAYCGGTEFESAIKGAVLRFDDSDIIMITDGASTISHEKIAQFTNKSHRFFTVGVGASVSEHVVKRLADCSGGAVELVTPNENIEQAILNQFRRIDAVTTGISLQSLNNQVIWESNSTCFSGEMAAHFVQLGSEFNQETARFLAESYDTPLTCNVEPITGTLAQDILRLIAALKIKSLPVEEVVSVAVKYQIICSETAFWVRYTRDKDRKAIGMPMIVKVANMTPVGHCGIGSVKNPTSSSWRDETVSSFILDNNIDETVVSPKRLPTSSHSAESPSYSSRPSNYSFGARTRTVSKTYHDVFWKVISEVNTYWITSSKLYVDTVREAVLSSRYGSETMYRDTKAFFEEFDGHILTAFLLLEIIPKYTIGYSYDLCLLPYIENLLSDMPVGEQEKIRSRVREHLNKVDEVEVDDYGNYVWQYRDREFKTLFEPIEIPSFLRSMMK